MKTECALELIPERMCELGYGDNYYKEFRQLLVPASGSLKIEAANEIFFLVEELEIELAGGGGGIISVYGGGSSAQFIRIESDNGIFDLTDTKLAEVKHEHTGSIEIKSLVRAAVYVKFIQVIPKNEKDAKQ